MAKRKSARRGARKGLGKSKRAAKSSPSYESAVEPLDIYGGCNITTTSYHPTAMQFGQWESSDTGADSFWPFCVGALAGFCLSIALILILAVFQ